MEVEKLATAAVNKALSSTDYLSSFINEGDKEPCWDGPVYIYSNRSKAKKTMIGRVHTQVKGKVNNDFSKRQITFQASVIDLNRYLHDGGVVFFVVYISSDGDSAKIYWSDLLPIKLRIILAGAKGQNTKSITLSEFPSDKEQMVVAFKQFLDNSNKQKSFAKAELLSMEELERQGILTGITMSVSGSHFDRNDPISAFFTNDVYMYADIRGSSIPQPLGFIPQGIHAAQEVDGLVTVNDEAFYPRFTRIRSIDKTVVKIGNSFEIVAPTNQSVYKMNFKTTSILCDAERDLRFFLSALAINEFRINGMPFALPVSEAELEKFDINKQNNILLGCQRTIQVFELLGIDTHIDMNTLTETDRINIGRLYSALIQNKPVCGLNDNIPFVATIEIAGNKVALAFQHCDEKNAYIITDFFKTKIAVCCYIDEKQYPISQYAILHKDEFLSIANINYSVLLPSFQDVEANEMVYGRANFMLLDLLSAYDVSNDTKPVLLQTAKEFAEWLCGLNIEDDLPFVVREMNRLQVIKRERPLDHEEKEYLCNVVEDSAQREDVKVGAYLLLDNQAAAEVHFRKVEAAYQDEFRQYPIFRFWQGSKGGQS